MLPFTVLSKHCWFGGSKEMIVLTFLLKCARLLLRDSSGSELLIAEFPER